MLKKVSSHNVFDDKINYKCFMSRYYRAKKMYRPVHSVIYKSIFNYFYGLFFVFINILKNYIDRSNYIFKPVILGSILLFAHNMLVANTSVLITDVQEIANTPQTASANTADVSSDILPPDEIEYRIKNIKRHWEIPNLQAELDKMPPSTLKDKLQKELVARGIKIFYAEVKLLLKDINVNGITASKIEEIDNLSEQIWLFGNFYEKIIPIKKNVALKEQISLLKSKKIDALYKQELKTGKLYYTAEKIKKMFTKGVLPRSFYSQQIWDEPILDEREKAIKYFDRNIDNISAQICALLMHFVNQKQDYWEGESGIKDVSKMEIIGSFAKYTKEKGTADFYFRLAKTQPEIFENIMDSMLNQHRSKSIMGALYFKANSWIINKGLSSYNMDFIKSIFAQNGKYRWDYINYFERNPSVFFAINGLTDFIANSPLKYKMTLYRGEQLDGLLNFLKDADGNIIRAGTEIENFIINHPQAAKADIEKFVDGLLTDKEIKQDRFLSTTLSRDLAVEWAASNRINEGNRRPYKVVWKINAEAGSLGMFLEIFNSMSNNYYDQYEFLFQRSSLLKYIGCNFDKETGILEIEARLIQPKQPEKIKIIYYGNYVRDLFINHLALTDALRRGKISEVQFDEQERKINTRMVEEINKGNWLGVSASDFYESEL